MCVPCKHIPMTLTSFKSHNVLSRLLKIQNDYYFHINDVKKDIQNQFGKLPVLHSCVKMINNQGWFSLLELPDATNWQYFVPSPQRFWKYSQTTRGKYNGRLVAFQSDYIRLEYSIDLHMPNRDCLFWACAELLDWMPHLIIC